MSKSLELEEALKEAAHWRTMSASCSKAYGDCAARLKQAKTAADTLKSERNLLQTQLTEASQRIEALEQRIDESAVNCPSCGRHDFGLMSSAPMAAGLLLQLKAECEKQHARAEAAEAQVEALTAELQELEDQGLPGATGQ